MKRDPWNGLLYPYYCVWGYVWNKKEQEYFPKTFTNVQTREEAIQAAKIITVSKDLCQVRIDEEGEDYSDTIAMKDATTGEDNNVLYDPNTYERIA